jgi:galactosylceramidase
MKNAGFLTAVLFLYFLAGCAGAAPHTIQLDPASSGRVFEGVGAVSAGGSSRLLPDYSEPQRSQILDFLFKPKFGAAFQHLKVEIGSGENATCGSEPSHVVTRDELANPKPRGFEFWLMAEARKRNPKIVLDCLPWAFPRWVGQRFSQESADWFAAFLQVARQHYGLELDWIAPAQNEMGTDLEWVRKILQPTLVARGFGKVKFQAPDDDSEFWRIFDTLEKDPELDRLIGAVGYHYLDGRNPWEIDQKFDRAPTEKAKRSGKPLWASEEWSQSGKEWGGKGALYLARLMNKLYVRDRVSKFEIWCPIDSIYDQIIWADTGVMQADTPWCGYYNVWPAVWAVAHTTQFAEPGWVYMDSACGQIDTNTWRGTHVALRDPKTGDWSVIVVTGEKTTVRIAPAAGLKAGPVHVWKSTAAEPFIALADLSPSDGLLDLEADAVYTFTTTEGQQKGTYAAVPARTPFPFPFREDFDRYKVGDTPRYFSDQKGSFEVCSSPRGGMCLVQLVPAQGILWFGHWLLKPHSLFGSPEWKDYAVEADVRMAGGDVEVGGRYAEREKLGYRWILTRDGRWQLNWLFTTLASGQLPDFDPMPWYHLKLEMKGNQISGFINGKQMVMIVDDSNVWTASGKGMAFIASSYDRNLFDNVCVGPVEVRGEEHQAPSGNR